jgi:hypothetical protein
VDKEDLIKPVLRIRLKLSICSIYKISEAVLKDNKK